MTVCINGTNTIVGVVAINVHEALMSFKARFI